MGTEGTTAMRARARGTLLPALHLHRVVVAPDAYIS